MIFSSICYAMIGGFLQLQRTGLCSPLWYSCYYHCCLCCN